MAIEKLSVILELVSGNYKKEAREAATATGQIGQSAKTTTGSLAAMVGPAAIGAAVVGLGRMALAAGENADRLFDLQAQTGLSTDALQEWEFVAKTAGANTEVFSDAVKAVIRNLNEAEGATGAAGKAYQTLGINVLDANGKLRDAGSITDEVFLKLAGMENITARNALAQDIFGKKWEETISVLDLGADAIANARGEAHELGAVISGDSLAGADRFRESFEKLKTVLSGQLMEILGDLGPVLADVTDEIVNIVDELGPLLDGLGFLVDRYSDLKGGLDDAKDSENAFLSFLGEAGDMVFTVGGGLGALAQGIDLVSGAGEHSIPVVDAITVSWQRSTVAITSSTAALEDNAAALAAADDAELSMLRAQQQREEAQTRLIELTMAGTATADELRVAQLELNIATRNGELATLAYNDSLDALDGKQVNVRINTLLNFQNVQREALEDLLPGGRQHGGPVQAGRPYMVGEGGGRPELFIPNQSGSIVSNRQLMAALGRPNSSLLISVQSPMKDFRADLQYAAIMAQVVNMVEAR